MMDKNIQPFVLKYGNSINYQPNDNGPNAKLKSLYNVAKSAWMLKYGTTDFSPHHMILSWFNHGILSSCQLVTSVETYLIKKMYPPLIPKDLTKNTQVCAASIEVSSVSNTEEINNISLQTVAPIDLHVTSTNDPVIFLQEKGMQQLSRTIILRYTVYDAMRKIRVIHIQDIKK